MEEELAFGWGFAEQKQQNRKVLKIRLKLSDIIIDYDRKYRSNIIVEDAADPRYTESWSRNLIISNERYGGVLIRELKYWNLEENGQIWKASIAEGEVLWRAGVQANQQTSQEEKEYRNRVEHHNQKENLYCRFYREKSQGGCFAVELVSRKFNVGRVHLLMILW